MKEKYNFVVIIGIAVVMVVFGMLLFFKSDEKLKNNFISTPEIVKQSVVDYYRSDGQKIKILVNYKKDLDGAWLLTDMKLLPQGDVGK